MDLTHGPKSIFVQTFVGVLNARAVSSVASLYSFYRLFAKQNCVQNHKTIALVTDEREPRFRESVVWVTEDFFGSNVGPGVGPGVGLSVGSSVDPSVGV